MMLILTIEKALKKNWSQEYGYISYILSDMNANVIKDVELDKKIRRFFKMPRQKSKIYNEHDYNTAAEKLTFVTNNLMCHLNIETNKTQVIINYEKVKNNVNTLLGDTSYSIITLKDFQEL